MKKLKKIASMMLTLSLLVGLLPQSVEATYSGISSPTRDANGNVTYSCIYFGNYWQADTNGDGRADKNDSKEPIKWRVLSVDGTDAYLLADWSVAVISLMTSLS